MKIAFGHMHYTPAVFWGMSLREWQCALKGYIEKVNGGPPEEPMDGARLKELMEKYPDDRPTD